MTTAKTIFDEATKYKHKATEFGCESALLMARKNKKPLDKMFNNNPHYNGNEQIVFKEEFIRENDLDAIRNCIDYFHINIKAERKIIKKTDKNGDTMNDALSKMHSTKTVSSKNLTELKLESNVFDFDYKGDYIPSVNEYSKLCSAIRWFRNYNESIINENMKINLDSTIPEAKITVGMKTSRAFNKICSLFGFSEKDEEYKKEFPKYADLINGKNPTRKVVMSTNFIDFMRMSFGNTWSSCMTIDNSNIRGIKLTRSGTDSYRGMHANGVLSYALDGVTFIMYVVNEDADSEHPEDTDKIYRCLFHYKDGVLIQGRVYPQCFDGSSDLSIKLRHIAQREICKCLGIDYVEEGKSTNDTWKLCGRSNGHNESYNDGLGKSIKWHSFGTHYADYDCGYGEGSGTVSYIKGYNHTRNGHIIIGHTPICLKCGKVLNDEGEFYSWDHYSLCHYNSCEDATEVTSIEENDEVTYNNYIDEGYDYCINREDYQF